MSGRAVRETLGFLAVVAGLVFVGVEIRQNNSLARGQARQALADMSQDWLLTITQDPEYYELWSRAWVACDELAGNEGSRATLMMIEQIRRIENVFFQYSEGLVDESALASYGGAREAPHFRCPRFSDFWDSWRDNFDGAFVEFFDRSLGRDGP